MSTIHTAEPVVPTMSALLSSTEDDNPLNCLALLCIAISQLLSFRERSIPNIYLSLLDGEQSKPFIEASYAKRQDLLKDDPHAAAEMPSSIIWVALSSDGGLLIALNDEQMKQSIIDLVTKIFIQMEFGQDPPIQWIPADTMAENYYRVQKQLEGQSHLVIIDHNSKKIPQ